MSLPTNILVAVFDDLRPQLGAYDHPEVLSPNINTLAASPDSTLFTRAYTNYAYCCPSRNSFMSGRMPGTTKVFNFLDSFRDDSIVDREGVPGTAWLSLPGYFHSHGYWTRGTGKLFHPNLPPDNDNAYGSWSVNATDPEGNQGCTCPSSGVPGAPMYCRLPENTTCPDVSIAESVVSQLQEWHGATESGAIQQPFFIGMGIHKPHLPWGVPGSFFDQYPAPEQLPLAQHKYIPVDMPAVAYHHCQWGPFPWNSTRGHPVSDTIAGKARRGYYAATTFADHLLGLALAKLRDIGQENNTIVAVMSDHGWLLGEHNEWCKETVFENAVRVPLIIRDPLSARSTTGGRHSDVFVENIDLYRTLAELAGLPPPSAGVDGESVAAVVRDPQSSKAGQLRARKTASFSQHARCLRDPKGHYRPIDPFTTADSCTITPRDKLDWMGYSMRTTHWRFTQWVGWNASTLQPIWSRVNATELYNHTLESRADAPTDNDFDAWENVNLANRPELKVLVGDLASQLRDHFSAFALPYNPTAAPTQNANSKARENSSLENSFFENASPGQCPCHGQPCSCEMYCGHNDICGCCDPDQCTGGNMGECCEAARPKCGTYPDAVCCDGVCTTEGLCCPSTTGSACDGHGECVADPSPQGAKCDCENGWSGDACQTHVLAGET